MLLAPQSDTYISLYSVRLEKTQKRAHLQNALAAERSRAALSQSTASEAGD